VYCRTPLSWREELCVCGRCLLLISLFLLECPKCVVVSTKGMPPRVSQWNRKREEKGSGRRSTKSILIYMFMNRDRRPQGRKFPSSSEPPTSMDTQTYFRVRGLCWRTDSIHSTDLWQNIPIIMSDLCWFDDKKFVIKKSKGDLCLTL